MQRGMGCCGCFGFLRKPQRYLIPFRRSSAPFQEFLLPENMDDHDGIFYNRDYGNHHYDSDSGSQHVVKHSEEILLWRAHNGLICREIPVKETRRLILSERQEEEEEIRQGWWRKRRGRGIEFLLAGVDESTLELLILIDECENCGLGAESLFPLLVERLPLCEALLRLQDAVMLLVNPSDDDGNKMINEYVRQCKIGSGSYGKVVLYRSTKDGKQYAIKIFHKSHLLKSHVAPSETAMNDVLREVAIMKMLDHPNIVNLIEVIDDPNTDNFYMVLEYVEGKWNFEGSGAANCLGESTTRRYLRDIVAGLMYLHSHVGLADSFSESQNVIHGDIKPDNLLVTRSNNIKIGDFSVSQVFEDNNDVLRRSPGTPVFTAPECCLDVTYHGKAADTWAVGVTLYCMVFGQYPFLGETLQDTYDKIVNNSLIIPDEVDPQLRYLIEGLLCKDPKARLTLRAVSEHPWVISDDGPIPQYLCRCSRLKSST
ncbi:hypothetical protein ZIOFF_074880 [Zingiber officinale]|uniref:non-specific serine/threonine protein kinase n=1 Tax=Zingiber officinale TaxID=94328 RepID=A0A8J5ELA6_ZINOF|nr:hypothetical protein ZIOFF_074880 [Zingiber officinale]